MSCRLPVSFFSGATGLFLCSVTAMTFADTASSPGATLAPVVIETTRLSRSLDDTPLAVTRIERADIADGQPQLQLAESLGRVPGLYLQNSHNFAQGQRISARGFGARAPFGIRGLRILYDGIPETLPDGQSQVDALDLDSAASINVIRGPASVQYGNASGGVIDVRSVDGRDAPYTATVRGEAGEYGYRKLNARLAGSDGSFHHQVSLTELDYDGYRQQSAVRQRRLNAGVGLALTDQRSLTLLLNALDTDTAQDPGGLTRQQVRDNRRQAVANAINLDAGQAVRQQRVGLRYEDSALLGGSLSGHTFFTRREFVQQLPFPGSSLVSYDRNFYGAGIDYTREASLLGLAHRYVLGADIARQEDDRLRRNVNPAGEVTAISGDALQTGTSTGFFLQSDSALTETLTLTLGARADRVRLAIDDRLTTNGDDSGSRTFDEYSYGAGLLWHAHVDHQLYANVGTAFETPTFTEFANPDGSGGFNPDISPQKTRSAETGARGMLLPRLRYDVALFAIRVRDEITPFEQDGRTFYENAARTERQGLELALIHATTARLQLTAAWTWASYRFDDFLDRNGNDFSHRRLPGLPRHTLFTEAAWRHEGGHFVIMDSRFASDIETNNANDERAGSHAVVNTRIGRQWAVRGQRLDTHLGINNVFNRDYFSNIRINASNGQYYEPAPDRMIYAGLSVTLP
ncbi:TonB-dependent receptor family protein [Isoalcanivorax indicus]|uniref:TonB-dependent receptor family protein n=1 Tax=Isoalcanivorax indicus TaxID=2202653 RepID=UPI001FE2D876|nr:TonB-dependent receptor [Isoalcanivorax indicus]